MDTIRICDHCRKPLPPDAPEELCPECLARAAFGSEPGTPGTRVPPTPAELAAQFPQLEILQLLGMGGMGMVYKARQPKLDRLVGLKILPIVSMPDASFAERFEREAKALARLNHPGIVAIYDFGQTKEYYYFVMEFVDGMNLRQLIQTKSLKPHQALELVMQICTALQFAHDEKIVHRDIKPENILITKKGQVKIADFGLAKLLDSQLDTALTASQMAMGTLNYMAPEQRENTKEVDHRADIYSLGVVFYEMLTGEVPMGRFEVPSKKVQVDVRLDEVVLHALEREPARRYQHVSEVRSNVETITSSMPKEKGAPGRPGSFQARPVPGFASYVFKWFLIIAGAWLAVGLCLHWTLGDAQMFTTLKGNVWSWALGDWVVTFAPSQPVPERYILLGICASLFYLGIAWIILPAIFILLTYGWFDAHARCGLKIRQLPPALSRRYWLWTGAAVSIYAVLVLGLPTLWKGYVKTSTPREIQNSEDEASEWYFIPDSGAFDKLGLIAAPAAPDQNGTNDPSSWSSYTISLIVHRANAEPAVMKVNVPGLRASYRFPITNSWDYNLILDKDALVEWLLKASGLNVATSKFQDEAGQVYHLLKAYELQPPQTAKEFVNLAEADLRDFRSEGSQPGGFNIGAWFEGPFRIRVDYNTYVFLVYGLLGIESMLFLVFTVLVTRRVYRAAWAEIESGRWTPPQ
jgi:tRNA A-37 threonylcarbamoyl transferase component Bud32